MKSAIKEAGNFIKQAGFGYIKVELEGHLGRRNQRVCDMCSGAGRGDCQDCGGDGVRVSTNRQTLLFGLRADCETCAGEGIRQCSACNGRGNTGSYRDEGVCEEFMSNEVALAVYGKPIVDLMAEQGLEAGEDHWHDALEHLSYGRFYYDGSVDSEYTFTLPVEHMDKIIHYVHAFKKLASVAGGGLDIRGSGMHISVLPQRCNGVYPTSDRLDSMGLQNFTNEVSKLLPALYFVGTAGHRSRKMEFRHPRITSGEKYSAIYTHSGTCLEYRLFETCYDKPEAIYDFIQVIAQTLRFYKDPSLRVKALGKKFGFVNSVEIAKYYSTKEQLQILNATVKYVKPVDKSFKKLKQERGVYATIKALDKKEKIRIAQLRQEYQELKKHHDYIQSKPLSKYELSTRDMLMIEDNLSVDKAEQIVLENRGGSRLVDFTTFLKRNLTPQRFTATINV